jgi:Tfp pilus assembly protein FimT
MRRWLTLTTWCGLEPERATPTMSAPLEWTFIRSPIGFSARRCGKPVPVHPPACEAGVTLSEILVIVALVSTATLFATPRLVTLHRETALRTLTSRLCGHLMTCRAHAIFHHCNTGVVFERSDEGGWRCFIAEDGDGDGILRRDLDSGRDPVVGEILQLTNGGATLGILFSQRIPDPLGNGWLEPGDPVRAGRGDIISFTPEGTSTASSIYLTDHHSCVRVVRVLGTTGRLRSLLWRSGWPEWQQSWW